MRHLRKYVPQSDSSSSDDSDTDASEAGVGKVRWGEERRDASTAATYRASSRAAPVDRAESSRPPGDDRGGTTGEDRPRLEAEDTWMSR